MPVNVLVISPFVSAAEAKMRTERLAIERSGRGDARVFTIEIAATDREKARGLMFRSKLADDEGMLFFYGRQHVMTMWMRNTYIPLDMIFIRGDGSVHRIEANTTPLSEAIISSGAPVQAVLEIPGGAAARLDIVPGDKVLHSLFGTAAAKQ